MRNPFYDRYGVTNAGVGAIGIFFVALIITVAILFETGACS